MKHTEYIIPIGEEAKDFDEIFIGVLRKHKELIRCKGCKHNKNNKWVDCPVTEFFGRTLDNYCSLAERKEE